MKVTEPPKVGDLIWHYTDRIPSKVDKKRRNKSTNEVQYLLISQLGKKKQEWVGEDAILCCCEWCPQEGDRVVVLDGVYFSVRRTASGLYQSYRLMTVKGANALLGGVTKSVPYRSLAIIERKSIEKDQEKAS